MSHLHRFYNPHFPPAAGAEISLADEEAHHALSVVRLRDGERVAVFDGRGTEAVGPLHRQGKRGARVLIESVRTEVLPRSEVTLAPAWLHRDKPIEEIIRRGTELGIRRFAFWHAQRSQRPPSGMDKWERLAVESCKQSGRLHLPEIEVYDSLQLALDSFAGCILLADAEAEPAALALPAEASRACALVVGPEGDFAAEELGALRACNALSVSLGPQVLRTEVASIALATLVLGALGALGTRLLPPCAAPV